MVGHPAVGLVRAAGGWRWVWGRGGMQVPAGRGAAALRTPIGVLKRRGTGFLHRDAERDFGLRPTARRQSPIVHATVTCRTLVCGFAIAEEAQRCKVYGQRPQLQVELEI